MKTRPRSLCVGATLARALTARPVSPLNAATHCCCVAGNERARQRNPRSHKRGALSQSLPFSRGARRRETPRFTPRWRPPAPTRPRAAARSR